MRKLLLLLFLLIPTIAAAQTSSSFTLGARRYGTTLPASCSDTRLIYRLTQVDGANQPGLYYCNGTNYVNTAGSGAGDVVGPSASSDNELPLFNGTGGKIIKRSNTLTGYIKVASGVVSAAVIPEADLPSAINAAKIADGSVSSAEFQFLGSVTSDIQTQINTKAPTASPTFTGTVIIPSPFTLGATSVTTTGAEFNFVAGVTSAIQTQLNAKSPTASPTFTGTVTIPSPFTLGATSVTTTGAEFNFVSGVTSAIQTQLDAKAPLASPTFTGVPAAPTAAVDTNTTQIATTAFVIGQGYTKGAASSTDNAIARFDSTTGKLIQNSGVTIDDSNNVSVPGTISSGDGTVAGEARLFELTANGTEYRSWLAPDALTATIAFRFPNTSPTAGQAMTFGAPSGGISDITFTTVSTPSSTDTLTNKTLDVEGTGNSLTTVHTIWLTAAGCNNTTASTLWDLPTATPAVAACVTGTNTQKGVLQFADTTGGFSAQNAFLLPADFTGNVDARIIWRTSATTGNAKWSLSTICTAVDATETDDPAFNTASTATTAAPGVANRLQTSSISSVTITGCAAGEFMHVKLFRDGNDAADTIAATAEVIGVEIKLRRAQ